MTARSKKRESAAKALLLREYFLLHRHEGHIGGIRARRQGRSSLRSELCLAPERVKMAFNSSISSVFTWSSLLQFTSLWPFWRGNSQLHCCTATANRASPLPASQSSPGKLTHAHTHTSIGFIFSYMYSFLPCSSVRRKRKIMLRFVCLACCCACCLRGPLVTATSGGCARLHLLLASL
jgi:hypothetical protein